jgi:5'-deoxynucleotidase YfbR-like HD superfamily hydrolase
MPRRIPPQSLVSAPYMKSHLQLDQWAEYEALTAVRAKEKEARTAAAEDKMAADDSASALFEEYRNWQRSQHIREYVEKTMSLLPSDASTDATARAKRWSTWALELADKTDPALIQVEKFLNPVPL